MKSSVNHNHSDGHIKPVGSGTKKGASSKSHKPSGTSKKASSVPAGAAVAAANTTNTASSSSRNNNNNIVISAIGSQHHDDKDCACNRCKSYAGISPNSVRCYWEQYDSHELDCTDEVYVKVAEDVTYKLWELGNALKVYCRHAGNNGRLTTDLVNEVLKDMNVEPVLGANAANWDTIGYDGCYYFNSDRVVDLREEYLREYHMMQPGASSITSTWVAEDQISEDLLDLNDKLCDAIFLGDEETFIAASEVAGSHPFLCGILGLLLNKCTELLAFDYKRDTLERVMRFLIGLTGNSFLDQSNVNLELYYLSQIMINLMLGTENDGYFEAQPTKLGTGNGQDIDGALFVPKESPSMVDNPHHLINYSAGDRTPSIKSGDQVGQNSINMAATLEVKPELAMELDVAGSAALFNGGASLENGVGMGDGGASSDLLKNEYEALFIMMENGGFDGMKKEDLAGNEDNGVLAAYHTKSGEMDFGTDSMRAELNSDQLQIIAELKQDPIYDQQQATATASTAAATMVKMVTLAPAGQLQPVNGVDGIQPDMDQLSLDVDSDEENEDYGVGAEDDNKSEEYCVITTKMCDIEDMPLVCQCMGRLVGFWSYMYRECSYLLLKRVDQFFLSGVILLKCEYEWLVRAVQAVFALGELPFREFSVYLDKLHPTITPDWVTVHFNCCGVFLRDGVDAELYDLLHELCGDAILPFMLFRFSFMKQLRASRSKNRLIKCQIVPKVRPRRLKDDAKWAERIKTNGTVPGIDEHFEKLPVIPIRIGEAKRMPRIGFKFAGCRPLSLKQKHTMSAPTSFKPVPGKFSNHVIIANRKLLRPLIINGTRTVMDYDISCFNL